MRRVLFVALLAVGCKSAPENGYAVDLTIISGPSLSSSLASSITTLIVTVGGDEIASQTYSLGHAFSGQERFIYTPLSESNDITIAVLGRSATDDVAYGTTAVKLRHGATVTATVVLGTDIPLMDMAVGDMGMPDLSGEDFSGVDLANADLAVPDGMISGVVDMSTADMAPVVFPSCRSLAKTCGAAGTDDCCKTAIVSGGTYFRSYDVAGDANSGNTNFPATVSDFELDKYEVTVGRFRQFVNAGMGTQASPPPTGAGARTLNGMANQGGWDASWNGNLLGDKASLTSTAGLKCDSTFQTWTDSPGANENRPINCISWYEAFAFCAWDGGFLPTEAEWNYAASGGSEQRAYPWSSPAGSVTIDNTYAVYNCGGGTCTSVSNIGVVGSLSPKGDGKWGQSDLAGNVWERTLDGYVTPYSNPCTDCSILNVTTTRAARGGAFGESPDLVRTGFRLSLDPTLHGKTVGVRCARAR